MFNAIHLRAGRTPRSIDRSRGFAFLLLAIILFLAAMIGLTVLADYSFRTAQRKTDVALLADVYRGITGDPAKETFGYLGDTGTYPTTLGNLIQAPLPAVTGWNGPYLSYPYVNGSTLNDSYGSPLDYFLAIAAATSDQIAVVARGPDHSSGNTAGNPNDYTQYQPATEFPNTSTYFTDSSNTDNIGYPALSSTAGTYNYQEVGTLQYLISEKDAGRSGSPVVDACPNLYDVFVTSHTRPTDTMMIQYNAQGAYDFLQGVWDVSVLMTAGVAPAFQTPSTYFSETVSIFPSRKNVRSVRGNNITSTTTPILGMTVLNNSGTSLTIVKNGTALSPAIANGASQLYSTTTCGGMVALAGAATQDTWIMPWGGNSIHAIANAANTFPITITNGNANNSNQLIVKQDRVTIGTVYLREKKTFNVPKWATVVVYKQDGVTSLATFTSNATAQTPGPY
jgi:hypothetical protein